MVQLKQNNILRSCAETLSFIALFYLKNVLSKEPMERTPDEIKTNLTKHKIVPDVIDSYPKIPILIRYSELVNADLGNVLKYEDIEEYVPLIQWPVEDDSDLFTLVMIDPDNPSRENPANRCWIHWIVGNIPRHHVMMGEHILKYLETRPKNGTGFHRYTAVVFQQNHGKIKFNESHIHEFNHHEEKIRGKFSVQEFARKYALGKPIGVNFFLAEWSYVPPEDDYDD